jgi:hypothetical protein
MTCSVLRCQNTGSRVMTVRQEPPQVEVVVCERHHLLIDSGARWRVEDQPRQESVTVLMGTDLPPLVEMVSFGEDDPSETFVTLSLSVRRGDGQEDQVRYDVRKDAIRDQFGYLGTYFEGEGDGS